MIVVDTSVWIALFRGADTPATRRLKDVYPPQQILLGDLVLLEILQGADCERHAAALTQRLAGFACVPICTPRLAPAAARNYRTLRARGITIRKSVDLLIGTYCIENEHRLLHDDRDFRPMADHLGLQEY